MLEQLYYSLFPRIVDVAEAQIAMGDLSFVLKYFASKRPEGPDIKILNFSASY